MSPSWPWVSSNLAAGGLVTPLTYLRVCTKCCYVHCPFYSVLVVCFIVSFYSICILTFYLCKPPQGSSFWQCYAMQRYCSPQGASLLMKGLAGTLDKRYLGEMQLAPKYLYSEIGSVGLTCTVTQFMVLSAKEQPLWHQILEPIETTILVAPGIQLNP